MFPTLSVTVIGLGVGGLAIALRRTDWTSLLAGVVGAWVGFAIGALVGLVVDVVFTNGMWVAWIGHACALAVALVAVARRLPITTRSEA